MTTLMIASLVTAMAALAVRVGLRKPSTVMPAAVDKPQAQVSRNQTQTLQCPVCGDRHAASSRNTVDR